MSLDDLKSLAASSPDLASRLAQLQSIADLQSIAAQYGISIDPSELEDQELSVGELSTVSGGIGMLLTSKLGLSKISAKDADNTDGCPTWDLDQCTVSTDKGSSPSCG